MVEVEEEKEVQEVDEDSKTSENGDTKETKENGSSEEKESDEKEAESTENGDSTGKLLSSGFSGFIRFSCTLECLNVEGSATSSNENVLVRDSRCPRRQLLRKEEIHGCG